MRKTALRVIFCLAAAISLVLTGCTAPAKGPERPGNISAPEQDSPPEKTPGTDPEIGDKPTPNPAPDPEPEPNPEPDPEPDPEPNPDPAPEIPAYSGEFVPEDYAQFLSGAIGRQIPLWGRFPFSQVYIFFPEILPGETRWTVYIAQFNSPGSGVPVAQDMTPTPQTLELPLDVAYDSAAPVYTGGGGGSGELEVVVELRSGDDAAYVSWDNFTYTDESDALVLVYRGVLEDWRIRELADIAPEVDWVIPQ